MRFVGRSLRSVVARYLRSLTGPALQFLCLICIASYALAFLFGLPAYLILRRMMRPSLWAASLVGGLVGALPVFLIIIAPFHAQHGLNRFDPTFVGGVFMAGILGGAVFYAVAAWSPNATLSHWNGAGDQSRPGA